MNLDELPGEAVRDASVDIIKSLLHHTRRHVHTATVGVENFQNGGENALQINRSTVNFI